MLERYVIIERIAVGGMGEVFVARQEGVGNFRRTVVLKKLLKDTEGSEEAVERMLDEARINGALSHENVVAIIEVGSDDNLPWMALEYVHGENAATLRARASKRGVQMPVVAAARIVADSARGLHHAHTANDVDGRPLHIVHRDIAPKNIFVRHDGVSKVGDFGIARADARLSHTATGALAGTLSYMSPEQLTSKPLGPSSDQFALGVVFWELLTGQRLFKGEGLVDTAERILTSKIRPPSRYRSDIGADVDAIVLRMLRREPEKRFSDLGEVADAIEAALPDATSSVGRAAVASFVEDMVGNELRERQRRIEEGAEQTVRADRPRAWEDPSSSRKSGTPRALTASEDDTRHERHTSAPRSRWPLLLGAALVVVVVGAAIAVATLPPAADPDRVMREHLHHAWRVKPLSFREVVVVDSVAACVSSADAEALANDLTDLMRARLDLLVTHWDKSPADRQRERVDVKKAERALIEQLQHRLARLGDKPQLKTDLLDMWQYDSSAPIRFLPPLTLEQIQARVYPNGVELMKETREERWDQVGLIAKRCGADPAVVRARLSPLVTHREQLLEAFGTAPPERLPLLEQEMAGVVDSGVRALDGVLNTDCASAVAYVGFITVPSSQVGEPEIDQHVDADAKN